MSIPLQCQLLYMHHYLYINIIHKFLQSQWKNKETYLCPSHSGIYIELSPASLTSAAELFECDFNESVMRVFLIRISNHSIPEIYYQKIILIFIDHLFEIFIVLRHNTRLYVFKILEIRGKYYV